MSKSRISIIKALGDELPGVAQRLQEQVTLPLAGAIVVGIFLLWCLWSAIYRLYFHPLSGYPGPLLWRISILPSLYWAWVGDRHLVIDKLHKKYAMYGPGTVFEKAMFYTRGPKEKQLLINLASTTDKVVHARKRRIISHAMSEAAIRSYEPVMLDKIRLFCERLQDPKTFGGEYKNMSRWFSYLTYDIMGTLTFSQSYDMLTKDDHHFIQPLIDSYQHSQVILGTYPKIEQWGFAPLLFLKIMADNNRFRAYVDNQVESRIALEKSGNGPADIFKLLLNHKDKQTGESMEFKELSDEAVVLIIAGTALSGLYFYLARYPECYGKLKHEIRTTFSSIDEIVGGKKLLDCKYMRACVDEALRMSPGVPGYLTREAPEGGTIDGYYMPPAAQVGIPTWTIHRDPDVYPEPQIFKPERWLVETDEEMQRLRSCWYPFSTGTRGCIGKNMAYHSIYLTVARLTFQFEIESREPLPLEFHVKDHFAAGEKNGPFLKFIPAKKSD